MIFGKKGFLCRSKFRGIGIDGAGIEHEAADFFKGQFGRQIGRPCLCILPPIFVNVKDSVTAQVLECIPVHRYYRCRCVTECRAFRLTDKRIAILRLIADFIFVTGGKTC